MTIPPRLRRKDAERERERYADLLFSKINIYSWGEALFVLFSSTCTHTTIDIITLNGALCTLTSQESRSREIPSILNRENKKKNKHRVCIIKENISVRSYGCNSAYLATYNNNNMRQQPKGESYLYIYFSFFFFFLSLSEDDRRPVLILRILFITIIYLLIFFFWGCMQIVSFLSCDS